MVYNIQEKQIVYQNKMVDQIINPNSNQDEEET